MASLEFNVIPDSNIQNFKIEVVISEDNPNKQAEFMASYETVLERMVEIAGPGCGTSHNIKNATETYGGSDPHYGIIFPLKFGKLCKITEKIVRFAHLHEISRGAILLGLKDSADDYRHCSSPHKEYILGCLAVIKDKLTGLIS